MTDWYERSFKALQLAGYAEKSQQCYLRDTACWWNMPVKHPIS
jgi:hypothetical protein